MNILDKVDAYLNEEKQHPAKGLWQKRTKEEHLAMADLYAARMFLVAEIGFLHKGGEYVFRLNVKTYSNEGSMNSYEYGPAETYKSEKEAIEAAKKYYNSIKKQFRFRS